MSAHKCQGQVWQGYHHHPCGNSAKYEHEGRHYCKTHHPPAIAEKRAARDARWAAEAVRLAKERKLQNEVRELREHKAACFAVLLEALKYAVDNPEFKSDEFDRMARAAIQKAEGTK
jgi:hypothetical protein